MFPKTLPRAAVRRAIQNEKTRREMAKLQPEQEKASMKGKFTLLHFNEVCKFLV